MNVAIVGAGFGGLAAAIELKRSGHADFTIFERNDGVGGVWQANTYPGAACDVPSEIYSFSYALKRDWSRRFGSQPEIRDYLRDVAHDYGLDDHLRFGAEVTSAAWEDDHWRLTIADGGDEHFDVVICATGQLSRPRIPQLPGRFDGPQFHSAEWNHDVSLEGKKVAVVGGGASAIQVVPAIADVAARVTVVQRSPMWVVAKYDWATSAIERALNGVPGVARARHNFMWWKFEANAPLIWRWNDPLRKAVEWRLKRMIRRKVGARTAAKVTPDYAFGCNRVLLSSAWYPTLARDDVDVVASGVTELEPDGLVAADGTLVEADVIVWCTGFTPTEYLAPMQITGREGLDIRDAWAEGPEAYLGITAPGFPNMFMSYGPNTGSLTNTIIFLLERQASYIRQAIEYIAATGRSLDVRREVHDEFNAELQARMQRTVFTTGCPGWYTTDAGKVTTVWPGSHIAYARAVELFNPVEYDQGAAVPAAHA